MNDVYTTNQDTNAFTIGFTGTSCGMTLNQQGKLIDYLESLHDRVASQITLRHGDCCGADYEMHHIARIMGYDIIIHPPRNDNKRAYCNGDVILPSKDYLDRNHDIVDNCDELIATPKEDKEVLRSGTWATIRYARKIGKKVIVIYP